MPTFKKVISAIKAAGHIVPDEPLADLNGWRVSPSGSGRHTRASSRTARINLDDFELPAGARIKRIRALVVAAIPRPTITSRMALSAIYWAPKFDSGQLTGVTMVSTKFDSGAAGTQVLDSGNISHLFDPSSNYSYEVWVRSGVGFGDFVNADHFHALEVTYDT
jgi:hypothetical protein